MGDEKMIKKRKKRNTADIIIWYNTKVNLKENVAYGKIIKKSRVTNAKLLKILFEEWEDIQKITITK